MRDSARGLLRRVKSSVIRASRSVSVKLVSTLSSLGVVEGDTLLLLANDLELATALPAPRLGGLLGNSFRDQILKDVRGLLGPSGTLVLPLEFNLDPKRVSHVGELFDSRRSSLVGLSARLRGDPYSRCSIAPVLSLVAIGKNADWLMRGQIEAAPFPMGRYSPWAKLLQVDAKVALVGGASINTPMLLPAHLDSESYERPSFFNRAFRFRVVDEEGGIADTEFNLHACPFQSHYDLSGYADFKTYMSYLNEKYGLYSTAKVGNLDVTVYPYVHQYTLLKEEINSGVYLEDAKYW
ncbi:MAG: AAC(3) family N-acetyltransferase [Burkholderiales bacterium]|nr:AAC(3) family N-acetyltransferase [Burkholderiales bacterium]